MDRRRQGGHREGVAVGVADVRTGGPERVVNAHHVHLEGALHHLGVAAHERQLGRHARVGHHHVEPTEGGHRGFDGGLHLVSVRHVAGVPRGVPARPSHLFEQLGLEAGDRNPGASLMQALCEGRADAARRTGDENPAPFE